jgi:hypothetical protein
MTEPDTHKIPAPEKSVKDKNPADADPASAPNSIRVSVFEFSKVLEFLKVSKTTSLAGSDNSLIETAALALAKEIAARIFDGTFKTFEIIFRLAKRLKRESGAEDLDVSKLRPLVDAFCSAISALTGEEVSPGPSWIKFLRFWKDIQISDGRKARQAAFRKALAAARPIRIPDLPQEHEIQIVALFAQELSKLGLKFFQLIQDEIAEWLGKPGTAGQREVSDIIQLLISYDVIVCIHQGKGPGNPSKYIAGPALLALREQATRPKLIIDNSTRSTAVHGKERKYERVGRK